MKHSHINSLLLKTLLLNPGGFFSLYSTATAAAAPKCSPRNLWQGSLNALYARITKSCYNASVVPILDQWVQEGQTLDRLDLVTIIKELKTHRNYARALQVSTWMSEKRSVETSDVAIRLNLIAKVHGIEQAENYFNNTAKQLKVPVVYRALLSCYCRARQLEKAEATMQEMRDLGFFNTSWAYNSLLSMYYRTENHEKFDRLISEMENNGVGFDNFTYGLRLSAAAAASHLEGIDKILEEWESDPNICMDWISYSIAANGYRKAGAVEKALAILMRSEEQIASSERPRKAYECLMTQYAVLGKKDEALRLWKCYKKNMKVYNRGYICIMTSLSKFNDIECVEKIFEEWESEHSHYDSHYDSRIPNVLIRAYSKNGFLDKAESIVSRITMKDEKPNYSTWSILAEGYLDQGQIEKALDSATKAVSAAPPGWMPDKDLVVACLEYFKAKADLEGAEDFIELLRDKKIITLNMQERLLYDFGTENWTGVVGELNWNCPRENEETSELAEVEPGH